MKKFILILTSIIGLAATVVADTPNIFRGDFTTPNANVLAKTGDLYTGLTLGNLWIKTGGYNNTGWIQLVVNNSIGTSSRTPIGYFAGSGGGVTQATSITTGVTINIPTGAITTVSSTLAAGVGTQFTVTNSTVNATDVPVLSVNYSGTGLPIVSVTNVGSGTFNIVLFNAHASAAFNGPLVINFAVIKGSTN